MDIEKLCEEIKDEIKGVKNELKTNQFKLDTVKEDVLGLKIALLGLDGKTGVLGEISSLKSRQDVQEEAHTKLSLRFYLLIGVLSGSGILGGSWFMGWL